MPVTNWTVDVTTGTQMAADFNQIPAAYVSDICSYSKTLAAAATWNANTVLDLFSTSFLQEVDRTNTTPIALANGVATAYKPSIPTGQNYIIFPTPPARSSGMLITLRIQFGIEKGSLQSAVVQLRRKSDDSVVSEAVVRRDPDTDVQLVVFPTFIYGANDPYVTGGFRVVLFNNSGSNMKVSSTTPIRFAVLWSHTGLPI
jgi:hypothetical protein